MALNKIPHQLSALPRSDSQHISKYKIWITVDLKIIAKILGLQYMYSQLQEAIRKAAEEDYYLVAK